MENVYIRPEGGSTYLDAFARWGVDFSDGAISALMTPAPMKGAIENKTYAMEGKQVFRDTEAWLDERDLSLPFHLLAKDKDEFFARYNSFNNEVLYKKWFDLKTLRTGDTVFHLEYKSCQQFTQFRFGMALFELKVNEASPNRYINN